jgi:four helix bundle protein
VKTVKSFEDLDVWIVGRDIKRGLYELTTHLPKQEQFTLWQQIRTASISLTANIAEGYGRFHYKENIQFCRIARGSAYELLDHLITCKDLEYVDDKGYDTLRAKILRFIQLVNGYIRSIGKSAVGDDRQPSLTVLPRVANDD